MPEVRAPESAVLPSAIMEAGTDPLVTVVMPVRNEAAHIEAVLADVLGQTLSDPEGKPFGLEVLVVDGESTDDTRERVRRVAEEDPRVRLLENPRRLSSAARGIGARAARGQYVAYIDGHCRIPSRHLLTDMVGLFVRTGAMALSRPQPLISEQGGLVSRAISAARTSPLGHSTQSTIYDDREREVSPVSAGAMYRREVFEQVGHFDPAFDACEDVEFNWRVAEAQLPCFTSPALAVAYEPRHTFRALFKQMRRYGLGRARLHRKHPKAFGVESLIPLGFLLGLPLLAATPVLPSFLQWPLWIGYGLYALLSLFFSVGAAARKGWALLPLLPIAFFTIHTGLGTGYLQGWVTAPPRVDEDGP